MSIRSLLLKRQLTCLQNELQTLFNEISLHPEESKPEEMIGIAASLRRKAVKLGDALKDFDRTGEIRVGVFQDYALVRNLKLDLRFASRKWKCYLTNLSRARRREEKKEECLMALA